jgi:hypothetical protein
LLVLRDADGRCVADGEKQRDVDSRVARLHGDAQKYSPRLPRLNLTALPEHEFAGLAPVVRHRHSTMSGTSGRDGTGGLAPLCGGAQCPAALPHPPRLSRRSSSGVARG